MKHKNEIPEGQKQEEFGTLHLNDVDYKTHLTAKFIRRIVYEEADPRKVLAFIPGKIKKVFIKKGKKVKEGDRLLVLEAMKMNNNIFSPIKGTIKEVYVTPGMAVAKNALLVEFE